VKKACEEGVILALHAIANGCSSRHPGCGLHVCFYCLTTSRFCPRTGIWHTPVRRSDTVFHFPYSVYHLLLLIACPSRRQYLFCLFFLFAGTNTMYTLRRYIGAYEALSNLYILTEEE
jgi:hypothetical protein